MPGSDAPYGGRIIARGDGSVLYQIAARVFKEDRDIDGTLEYAVRKAVSSRVILASVDGKCLVQSQQDNSSAKFLIVSGYEAPEGKGDARLVGKAYYITADAPRPNMSNQQRMMTLPTVPPYNLTLRYDDYDLEHAQLSGLARPFGIEPYQLRLCYQHWTVAVYDEQQKKLVSHPQPEPEGFADAKKALLLEREMQRAAAALRFDLAAQLKDEIEALRQGPAGLLQVEWTSGWRRVQKRSAQGSAPITPVVPGHAVVPEDEPITAEEIIVTPGSRTVTAIGVDSPGMFVLMCHGECWKSEVDIQHHEHHG